VSGPTIVILGGEGPGGVFDAYSVDAASGVVGPIPADALTRRSDGAVVLVVPGADVQVRRLAIPARSEAQARSAARFMFDDAVADTSDVLHFGIGDAQDEEGRRLVVAISAPRLRAWLDACDTLGVAPTQVYADVTLWPTPDATVDIAQRGSLSLICGGRFGGYAIEAAIAPALLAKWASQSGANPAAVRCPAGVVNEWRTMVAPTAVTALPADLDPDHTIARAASDPPVHAPDLLQGEFARTAKAAPSWHFWRAAAAFVFLAFLVHSGAQALAGYRDRQAAAATLRLAERDLRAARPDVGRIVSLRAQVAALKADLERSRTHPVLAVNEGLVATLHSHPDVRLDAVRHAEPGRSVTLNVSANESGALDAFAAALKQRHASAEMRAKSPEGGRYVGEIVVQAP
jgi:general secretion pathway protein L